MNKAGRKRHAEAYDSIDEQVIIWPSFINIFNNSVSRIIAFVVVIVDMLLQIVWKEQSGVAVVRGRLQPVSVWPRSVTVDDR